MWKYFALAAFAGFGVYVYKKIKTPRSYQEYIQRSLGYASRMKEDENVVSKVLTAHLAIDSDAIELYLYRRYINGKVTKLKLPFKPFPLSMCPIDVQEQVKGGEYIVHKF